MSKVFKVRLLAYYLVLLLPIILSVIPQFYNPTWANHTIDDARITVTHSPDPVRADSKDLTFEINAKEPILPVGSYTFKVTVLRDGCQYGYTFDTQTAGAIVVSPTKIVVPTNIGCRAEAGERKFELWHGRDTSGNQIVVNYRFYVEQIGGGRAPEIVPLNQNLALSEMPEVELRNAKSGTTYSFWWDGSKTIVATKHTATADGTVGKIVIPKDGMPDPDKPASKTLCMEIGDYTIPSGCTYKAQFVFAILPAVPSGQPSCLVEPASPNSKESISVKAINLPKNQNFKAYLVIKETEIPLPQEQSSADSGIVSLPLAAFLIEGDYKAKVFNVTSGTQTCEIDFTVGPISAKAVSPDASKKQTLVITPCGSADSPGIATAIGCIHTSPVGFIKDFLKFILGIAGGLAFLMMLLGVFQMLTSAGNPETLNAGKDRLTSAVIGLLFIIFSVLLLQIIGVDILGLPGFQ